MRDHEGKLLRAQALWYDSINNALMAEAYAIRDGVRLACDLGYREVVLESARYRW